MALQDTDLLPLFRINDQSNRKISVADFSSYLDPFPKPGKEGDFVVVEDNAGNISYSETIDGGSY